MKLLPQIGQRVGIKGSSNMDGTVTDIGCQESCYYHSYCMAKNKDKALIIKWDSWMENTCCDPEDLEYDVPFIELKLTTRKFRIYD